MKISELNYAMKLICERELVLVVEINKTKIKFDKTYLIKFRKRLDELQEELEILKETKSALQTQINSCCG